MTLSPGLQEIYSGKTSSRAIDTLQIYHPSFSKTFFICNDVKPWNFKLETGQTYTFDALPFDLKLPDQSTGGRQELNIALCNIGREMTDELERAAKDGHNNITVTYRVYLDIVGSSPQNNPPLVLKITEVVADLYSINAVATRFDVLNKKFPTRLYTVEEFPGLKR